MLSRLNLIVLMFAVSSLAASGCSGPTQAENAARFKQRAAGLSFDTAYAPLDKSRPGMVAGVARSRDGVRSKFVFSFGPGPDKLPTQFRARRGTTWFDRGDKLEYWIQGFPPGLTDPAGRGYVGMVLWLQDIACRVVAERPCSG